MTTLTCSVEKMISQVAKVEVSWSCRQRESSHT